MFFGKSEKSVNVTREKKRAKHRTNNRNYDTRLDVICPQSIA